jgi:UDP-2-acetamido-3-amino-2,3-dideoxy-glucuronate N-acetyltransferase
MEQDNVFIHESSVVSENSTIGANTKIWHFSHIRENVIIGENVVIGQNVYIDEGVIIGNNVKIQNNVSVYKGVSIGDNVFIGPSVVFTNDLYPKVEEWDESMIAKTNIKNNVSLGANSTIIAGVEIGEFTLIGAGSVVTKNISKNSIAFGNPAKIKSKKYREE